MKPIHPALNAIPFLCCLVAGCTSKPASLPVVPDAAAASSAGTVVHLSSSGAAAASDRSDEPGFHDNDIILQLDIYQLTVPFGAISSNERFWKHIDEDHVDLAAHAVLLNNGVRFGIGPNDEWAYYKSLIDRYGATAQRGSTAPVRKGAIELPMRLDVDRQDIFYLDESWKWVGRTYEKCDNLLALAFEPTPRQPGDATIQVCALIRGLRKEFEVTVLNDTREIEYRRPEFLYDLRLRQNVPIDHFLVLAPGPMATRSTSLGQTFFCKPGGAEPTETVLILVPRPFHITGEGTRTKLGGKSEARVKLE